MKTRLQLMTIFVVFLITLPFISLLGGKNRRPDSSPPSSGTVALLIGGEVRSVPMREYIIGAVAAQMPADLHPEALKAQAVLAHTYALRRIREESVSPTPELKGAVIGDDPALYQAYFSEEQRSLLYGDKLKEYSEKLSAAADYALTRSLVFEGEPIIAAFHPVSAGTTESAGDAWGENIPYLVSVASPQDALLPSCKSEMTLSEDDLLSQLKTAFPELSVSKDALSVEVTERTAGGSAATVSLCGSSFVSGRSFAAALSLPSAHFDVSEKEGSFTFTCLGRGHLVGMSQLGADALASEGKSCEQILASYFPNARLENSENVK